MRNTYRSNSPSTSMNDMFYMNEITHLFLSKHALLYECYFSFSF